MNTQNHSNYVDLLNFTEKNPCNKYLKTLSVGGHEYFYYDVAALGEQYSKFCFIIVVKKHLSL